MQSPSPKAAARFRRRQKRRRRTLLVSAFTAMTLTVIIVVVTGGGLAHNTKLSPHSAVAGHRPTATALPPSIEAGVESWSLNAPCVARSGSGQRHRIDGPWRSYAARFLVGGCLDDRSAYRGHTRRRKADQRRSRRRRRDYRRSNGGLWGRVALHGCWHPVHQVALRSQPIGNSTGSITGTLPQPRSDLAVATISKQEQGPRHDDGLHRRWLRRHPLSSQRPGYSGRQAFLLGRDVCRFQSGIRPSPR